MTDQTELQRLWDAVERDLVAKFGENPDSATLRRYIETTLGEELKDKNGEPALTEPGEISEADALRNAIKLGQFLRRGMLAGYEHGVLIRFARKTLR